MTWSNIVTYLVSAIIVMVLLRVINRFGEDTGDRIPGILCVVFTIMGPITLISVVALGLVWGVMHFVDIAEAISRKMPKVIKSTLNGVFGSKD